MLTLFYKPTCPYCQRVLAEAEDMGVHFDLKDISTDEALVGRLIELGGKRQVPFLVDREQNIKMYESNDIIEYLKKYYADDASGEKENVCDSCQ